MIKVGSVVQLHPLSCEAFGGCLLTVTEIKDWGVVGYVVVPQNSENFSLAYYRAKKGDFSYVGEARFGFDEDRSKS